MASSDKKKRTDEEGRAFAGSQLQMQLYVTRRQPQLSDAVRRALEGDAAVVSCIRWVAPLQSFRFHEPVDGEFLTALGLGDAEPKLRQYWPSGGPKWDALAVLESGANRSGVLLAEAKSYPGEVYGPGCMARSPRSVQMIDAALDATKRWLGVPLETDWRGRLYQYANRLAHVYFLRQHLGVDAWLANLCFTLDSTTHSTTEAEWRPALANFKTELGFAGRVPWTIDVLLPAGSRAELLQADNAG